MRRLSTTFLIGALLVAIPVLARAQSETVSGNPLVGNWRIVEDLKPDGWIGFDEIEFTDSAMFTGEISVPVNYEIEGDQVEVEAASGEIYRYTLLGPDRICVPPPEVKGIETDEPLLPPAMDGLICYERI